MAGQSQTERTGLHVTKVTTAVNFMRLCLQVLGAKERDWVCLMGPLVQLGKMEKFWRWMVVGSSYKML